MLSFVDSDYSYGFHVLKRPTVEKTIRLVLERETTAAQFYISNSRSKAPPKFDFEDLLISRDLLAKHKDLYVVIHGCLLYNLAGTVLGVTDPSYDSAITSTIEALTAELDFGVTIGKVGVIIHPGSRKNRRDGHIEVAKTISTILDNETKTTRLVAQHIGTSVETVKKSRKLILENSAGEGTKLCATLEEIALVISLVPRNLKSQVKVCIDTAHGFGRGLYDWGKKGEIKRFYDDFDRIIGLKYLEVFHFNDSCKSEDKRFDAPFGSRKDRHQNLGLGYIFGGTEERKSCITDFVLLAREHGIPMIGEPPGPGADDFELVKELTTETEFPLVKLF